MKLLGGLPAWAVPCALALGLLMPGCAVRSTSSDYQVIRYGEAHYIYPPGLAASGSGPPPQATVRIPASGPPEAGRECVAAADGLQVERKGAAGHSLVATLRLSEAAEVDFEPSSDDNVTPKLRSALETLAETDCLKPEEVRLAERQVLENLPLRFNELLPHHYTYVRGGSAIDLSPASRLKIQQAVFDEAARAAARQAGSTGPLDGYLGTVTDYYDASSTPDGSVSLEPASRESDVPEDIAQRTGGTVPVALGSLKSRYLRLLFLGWLVEGDTERKSVLLAAEQSEQLERMSRAVLENPVGLCDAAEPGPASRCFGFSGSTSTEVEIRVRVNGEERYVLLGTALKAVAPPGAAVDADVLAKLRIRRRYGHGFVSVRLPPQDTDALQIPLLAGDQIDW